MRAACAWATLLLAADAATQDPLARLPVQPRTTKGVAVWIVDAAERAVEGADLLVVDETRLEKEWLAQLRLGQPDAFAGDASARSALARAALRYQSDREGLVRVPLAGKAIVVALQRGHVAAQHVDPARHDELDLRVGPRDGVEVLVVDSAGKPVAGLPLWLAPPGEHAVPWRGALRSDSLGRARLPASRGEEPLALQLGLIAASPLERALEPDERRGERPVTVTLPPFGAVRLVARDVEGRPLRGLGRAALEPIVQRPDGALRLPTLPGFGSIPPSAAEPTALTFAHVALDLELEGAVVIEGQPDAQTISGRGPRHAGELVVLGVEGIAPAPELTVAVLGIDGRALARTALVVQVMRPGRTRGHTLRTDDAGRFTLKLENELRDQDDVVLIVRLRGEGELTEYRGAAHLALGDATRPGPHELGPLRLQEETTIVAGTVVDDVGAPVPGLLLHASESFTDGGGPQSVSWSGGQSGHLVRSDAQGRFELKCGPRRPLVLRLSPTGREPSGNWLVKSGGEARPGDLALRLEIVRAAVVKGSIAQPLGEGERVRLMLRSVADGSSQGRGVETGPFVFESVLPGRYTLQVFEDGEYDAPAQEIGDLVIAAGETCEDPRLAAIRWSDERAEYGIELVDAAGKPLHGVLVAVVNRGHGRFVRGLGTSKGQRFVARLAAGEGLRFSHPEFCTRFADRVEDGLRVALQPRPRARVRVVGLPAIAEGLVVELFARCGEGAGTYEELVGVLARADEATLTIRPPGSGAMKLALHPAPRGGQLFGRIFDDRNAFEFSVEIPAEGLTEDLVLELDADTREDLAAALERLAAGRR